MKINRWKQSYKNLKLAQKMLLIYLVLLGVCLVLCLTALRVSFNIYDNKLYEKSLQELDFFTQQVNEQLDEVENLSYYIAIDTKIQEQLSALKEMKHFTAEYSYETYRLRMLMENELANSDMILNLSYTDGETTRFLVGTSKGTISGEQYDAMLERFHEAKGAYVVQAPTEEYPYLLSGRDIRKHIDSSLEYLGSLIITSDVAGMINKNIEQLEAPSSDLLVYSDQGVIYENTDHQVPEKLLDFEDSKGYKIVKYQGQRYFICYLKSSRTDWTYVNMFPYSEIYGQNRQIRYTVVALFLLLFAAVALVLKKTAGMVVKPLEQLTESMQIVEGGDFKKAREYLGAETGTDETGLLTQEFKTMLDKIDRLIYENYEKQLLLRDTKYKMLQAQINPHFLYNTLNSLHWMVRAGRNDEAAEMTIALGEILRAALSKKQYFTIHEEINMLRRYMVIQQYRYQKRIEFHLEESVSGEYLIPHMTLQPLVENAIYYGVDKMLTPCSISVTVLEEENEIRIQVSDTGPGMTKEELEAVRTFSAKPAGHGIGLKNIYERLKMAFDEALTFEIDSVSGQGTCVRIVIPKITEGGT